MRLHDIDIPEDKIARFCQRHGVARLRLFGSILRDDFSLTSDIDLKTPGFLSAPIREEVDRHSQVLYAA